MASPERQNREQAEEGRNKPTVAVETQEEEEKRVMDVIDNSENPWQAALNLMDNWKQEDVYCIIKNINKFENKLDPKTEKEIVIKVIKKCRQPEIILSHLENFKLLSKEDKKEIAQTFIDNDYVRILEDYLKNNWENMDKDSKEAFEDILSVRNEKLWRMLNDGPNTQPWGYNPWPSQETQPGWGWWGQENQWWGNPEYIWGQGGLDSLHKKLKDCNLPETAEDPECINAIINFDYGKLFETTKFDEFIFKDWVEKTDENWTYIEINWYKVYRYTEDMGVNYGWTYETGFYPELWPYFDIGQGGESNNYSITLLVRKLRSPAIIWKYSPIYRDRLDEGDKESKHGVELSNDTLSLRLHLVTKEGLDPIYRQTN